MSIEHSPPCSHRAEPKVLRKINCETFVAFCAVRSRANTRLHSNTFCASCFMVWAWPWSYTVVCDISTRYNESRTQCDCVALISISIFGVRCVSPLSQVAQLFCVQVRRGHIIADRLPDVHGHIFPRQLFFNLLQIRWNLFGAAYARDPNLIDARARCEWDSQYPHTHTYTPYARFRV